MSANLLDVMNREERLENELHLKQLQINRLLTITQAINENVKAQGLYDMYKSFLAWEMGVSRMALLIKGKLQWICPVTIGQEDLNLEECLDIASVYQRPSHLNETDVMILKHFEVVIPVLHKKEPIAYCLLGGFEGDSDTIYNKIQFITTITNIVAVAIENKRLFKQQLEQERMNRELELAKEMQQMLIPEQMPKNHLYHLAGFYQPRWSVGGDYFDYCEFEDGRLVFCIADIAGKGVAAALLMANFQATFQSLIHQGLSLEEFVKSLNQALHRITKGDRYLTLFVAEYQPLTRILNYINAGHNPPLLFQNRSTIRLSEGTTILGSFPQLPPIRTGHIILEKGAIVLAFTDGLTDVQNKEGNFYSEEKIIHLLQSRDYEDMYTLNQALVKDVREHKGEESFSDDTSILSFCAF